MKRIENPGEKLIGSRIRIHEGKIPATIVSAQYRTSVVIDYDGYLDPEDKRTRRAGRKFVSMEDLQHPERIPAGFSFID